jgi:DNA-binding Lrp family transcriptional regulator
MNNPSRATADLVFIQSLKDTVRNYQLDGKMLCVFVLFNGQKTLRDIAKELGYSIDTIQPIIEELIKLNLIKHHVPTVKSVDPKFLPFLLSKLSKAIGPAGRVVLEDALEDLGFTPSNFPIHRTAELVNMVSLDIYRENKRIQFKQSMLRRIQSFDFHINTFNPSM